MIEHPQLSSDSEFMFAFNVQTSQIHDIFEAVTREQYGFPKIGSLTSLRPSNFMRRRSSTQRSLSCRSSTALTGGPKGMWRLSKWTSQPVKKIRKECAGFGGWLVHGNKWLISLRNLGIRVKSWSRPNRWPQWKSNKSKWQNNRPILFTWNHALRTCSTKSSPIKNMGSALFFTPPSITSRRSLRTWKKPPIKSPSPWKRQCTFVEMQEYLRGNSFQLVQRLQLWPTWDGADHAILPYFGGEVRVLKNTWKPSGCLRLQKQGRKLNFLAQVKSNLHQSHSSSHI